MTPLPPRFTPDLLRWAISVSLLVPTGAIANNGLQPATGPGGTPSINEHNGVPVINIVAPSASGLSHNQFLDYNVGQPGVVLNNALHAGQSQLAGALGANPQFQGQAASTILNEVISRNASSIDGTQEIFGQPADYILANPNGITINGGSFINTTRAGFLVGRPEIEDQRLTYLNSLTASGELRVDGLGLSNAEGALELIAPRIESHGPLRAATDLDLTVGRNRIDRASGEIVEHLAGTPGSIDARLFGAMQAGRIRIISTAEGAGVRIEAPSMDARQGISIRSAGDLKISGSAQQRSRLDAGKGNLELDAKDNMTLSAVEGRAEQIKVRTGKNLTLDAKTRESIRRDNEKWDKKWWFVTTETFERTGSEVERLTTGSDFQAVSDITLDAGGDARLLAAGVQAGGDLKLRSGNTLEVSAGIDSVTRDERIRHRKHLWRGDQDTHDYRESARPSQLSGRNLTVEAAGPTRIIGSELRSSADMSIKTPELDIAGTSLKGSDSRKEYRGDLASGAFFGNRERAQGEQHTVRGSQLEAGGALTVIADEVRVSGSRISSTGDALLASEKALLSVEAARESSTRSTSSKDSKLFGLLGSSTDTHQQRDTALVSDLASESNLRLASADELRVIGARLKAGGQLQLDAAKDLHVSAATQSENSTTQQTDKSLYASARQTAEALDGKPASKQYVASAGYEVKKSERSASQDTLVASQLSGAAINIGSQADVSLNSSNLDSSGAIDISGKTVTLGAQTTRERQLSTSTRSAGGLAVTAGMDRQGGGYEGAYQRREQEESLVDSLPSELTAAGPLRIKADTLINEAAQVSAGEHLLVDATRVENRATASVRETRDSERNWQGSLGLSLETRDITRPIENLINGNEAARFQQASVEDALAPPTLGVDLALEHLNREQTSRSETARVSELSGTTVKVQADEVSDTGTRYRAEKGGLQIDARNHQFVAAQDTTAETVERLEAGGTARVETSTGKDIAGKITGKGGSLSSSNTTTTARPGSLYGQQGIQIQLGSDGLYEGTAFDAGKGGLTLETAGNLSLPQANDRQEQSLRQLDGNAWLKAGNSPAGSALEARGYLDRKRSDSQDSQARVASIDSTGDVRLKAGGELTLAGTRIGSSGAKPTNIDVQADGPLRVLAASDSHEASGDNIGGGGEVVLKMNDAGKGGGLGGHFSNGRISESDRRTQGAVFTAQQEVNLSSQARQDDAIHLEGLQASAERIKVAAENGGVLIESATSSERRDNLDLTVGAGIAMTPAATRDDTKKGLYGRAQFNLDQRDNLVHQNSQLDAGNVGLYSMNDMLLNGVRVNAGRIEGVIGGDLQLASRQDRVNALKVNVDAQLSREKNPQGYLNAVRSFGGPLGASAEKKVGGAVQSADPGISPTLDLKVDYARRDSVASQSRLSGQEGVALQVGGDVKLSGADVRSSQGKVELGSERISQETLNGRDVRRVVGTNLSNAPVELGSDLVNTYKNGGMNLEEGDSSLDLGLLRTGGHDREVRLESGIIEKK
ncbi:hemagglutinin repeat-containing protein [Pseudomonas sp. 5P_5.1_Bac1]|uniref:hemagglutinin repeat-containing protein n=1 Tax=Pseudomonas sp. 5P_5.1_Bac1 TaxID=2971616 RepID=UPI0021C7F57E|nr:hemagglutinin repeat-containing protein [Pseudomonas sp. 5P_5.1_Bac1]MCU1721436.1 hemagglutinin repeat-containing protein [Pseudomonas sp. 5P_5.1_Bac1]